MRFWFGFVAGGCVFVMGCVTGASFSSPTQASSKVLYGEAFMLEDGNGNLRGSFGLSNGEPHLTLLDGNGDVIFTVGQVGTGVIAAFKGVVDERTLPIARKGDS